MTSTDFSDILRELVDKAYDFPVMLWADGSDEPMPIISADEDGDEFCLAAAPGKPNDALLASTLIEIIEDIGCEMTNVFATYMYDGYSIYESIGDVSADEESRTVDLCPL